MNWTYWGLLAVGAFIWSCWRLLRWMFVWTLRILWWMLLVAFWPTYQAVAASYRAGRKTYLRRRRERSPRRG